VRSGQPGAPEALIPRRIVTVEERAAFVI